MNILFVASDNNRFSGAFLSMVKLTSLLKNKYHHKVFVVLRAEGTGKELLDEAGIENFIIPSYNWVVLVSDYRNPVRYFKDEVKMIVNRKSISRIADLIKEKNIELVHINTSHSYVGAMAALKANVPFVWHIREFLEEDQNKMIHNKKKGYELMKKAKKVVAISNSLYNKYAPILGQDKMRVIYNGIDPEHYLDKKHNIFESDTVRFLIVGKLSENKGQWQAIEACVKLHEKSNKKIHLSLVGQGDLEYINELETMIKNYKAEEYIEICGPQNDTTPYYKKSDIFLMCSKMEAFGRVTVEAMLAGCFVIGGRNAGTEEMIYDGVTGLLYENRNVDDLYEKMCFALDHQEDAKKMARVGQQYMLENMKAELNAEKINQLYAEIMSD